MMKGFDNFNNNMDMNVNINNNNYHGKEMQKDNESNDDSIEGE